jgi:hypothetical protein
MDSLAERTLVPLVPWLLALALGLTALSFKVVPAKHIIKQHLFRVEEAASLKLESVLMGFLVAPTRMLYVVLLRALALDQMAFLLLMEAAKITILQVLWHVGRLVLFKAECAQMAFCPAHTALHLVPLPLVLAVALMGQL